MVYDITQVLEVVCSFSIKLSSFFYRPSGKDLRREVDIAGLTIQSLSSRAHTPSQLVRQWTYHFMRFQSIHYV